MSAQTSPSSRTLEALRAKVTAHVAATKAAAESNAPTDPHLKGGIATKDMPEGNDAAQLGLPAASLTTTNPDQTGSVSPGAAAQPETQPAGAGGGNSTTTLVQEPVKAAAALQKSAGDILGNLSAFVSGAAPSAKQAATAQEPAAAPSDAETVKAATNMFASIGAQLYGTNEGKAFIEDFFTKQAGEAAALELLSDAKQAAAIYAEVGAREAEKRAAETAWAEKLASDRAALPAEKRAMFDRMANILRQEAQLFQSPADYLYWAKGAAAMEQAMAGAPEGELPAQLPGGDGSQDPQQVIMMIMEALQAGQITEQEAMQVLQEAGIPPEMIQQAMGGGAAGAPPAPAGPEAEAAKAASAAYAALNILDVPSLEAKVAA